MVFQVSYCNNLLFQQFFFCLFVFIAIVKFSCLRYFQPTLEIVTLYSAAWVFVILCPLECALCLTFNSDERHKTFLPAVIRHDDVVWCTDSWPITKAACAYCLIMHVLWQAKVTVFESYNSRSRARVVWWFWLGAIISFECQIMPVNLSVVLLSLSCGK